MNDSLHEKLSHFKLAFIIVKRGTANKALDIAYKAGSIGGTVFLGTGTAKSNILDLWGLEKHQDYEIILTSLSEKRQRRFMAEVSNALDLSAPGHGIMFILPFDGSAGLKILKSLVIDTLKEKGFKITLNEDNLSVDEEEESAFMNNREFELIISIINRGYADDAMDAAREAGAEGGIIVNGRGAGLGGTAEKFLGITVENEREILFNIVEKSKSAKILQAITDKAGIKTEARGISFMLPVDLAAGIVNLNNKEV